MTNQNKQKTIKAAISLNGIGLHSGQNVSVEILPATANSGITFLRTDTPNTSPVSALIFNVSATELCTTIGTGASSIATIEHLMAALAGLEIDNAFIKVNGPEIPILDGSSVQFVRAIQSVGIEVQNSPKRFYKLKKSFVYKNGDRFIKADPARKTKLQSTIDFVSPTIGRQKLDMSLSKNSFLKLCNARTFCHVSEVVALRKAGLAQGGSLDNAIVIDDEGVLNQEGLRSKNEFVEHKMLDTIGDFALLGAPLIGSITLHKPGHALHIEFLTELLRKRTEYLEIVTMPETTTAPIYESEDIPLVAAAAILT